MLSDIRLNIYTVVDHCGTATQTFLGKLHTSTVHIPYTYLWPKKIPGMAAPVNLSQGCGVGVGVARSRGNEQGVGVGVGVDQTSSTPTPVRFV